MDVKITWAEQNWRLLGKRALYWDEQSTLILSDVHLGKAEDFQAQGVAVPSAIHDEDLRTLEELLEQTRPRRLFVLGDFVHSNRAPNPRLARQFRDLKVKSPGEWTLVIGNHDLQGREALVDWGFDRILDRVDENGIAFGHEPDRQAPFNVNGHVHPVFKLKGARDRLRLPCFFVGPKQILLPAYGAFTGGFEIHPQPGDRVFLIADLGVIEWRD